LVSSELKHFTAKNGRSRGMTLCGILWVGERRKKLNPIKRFS